jgi:hypothetical protein
MRTKRSRRIPVEAKRLPLQFTHQQLEIGLKANRGRDYFLRTIGKITWSIKKPVSAF